MKRQRVLQRVLGCCLALSLAVTPCLHAASRYLPGLKFSVLRTPHFRIYYHRGEEALANKLAGIAEQVRATLPARLGLTAPPLTHVVLVDQDDTANGSATPLPYDTVVITAAWPAPSDLVGNTADWLRLVFTHEYTHVLHLDQSRGWSRAARLVFGRSAVAFPNLFLPRWEIEGLATYEESRSTGLGRLRSGDSASIIVERARARGPEPISALNGGRVSWPGGIAPYLYGGFFTDYLAARFGEDTLGKLARQSAGRIPYLTTRAFKDRYGSSLGDLWKDFQRGLAARAARLPGAEAYAATRLTHEGYSVTGPRFTTDGSRLVYSVQNADRLPELRILEPVASSVKAEGMKSRSLTDRYGGRAVGVADGFLVFDQLELTGNVAWRSDLYAMDLRSARTTRLTRGARLVEPDISPDGTRLACIRLQDGRRRLALFSLARNAAGSLQLSEEPRGSEPREDVDAVLGAPRWSPDGHRLALERRRQGGPSEIVVLDLDADRTLVLATADPARNLTPTWTPDGRTILFASDREGDSFQIYAVASDAADTPRRITTAAGGALEPEVSRDGRRLVYVGYTAAGYDLFETLLAPAASNRAEVSAVASRSPATPTDDGAGQHALSQSAYSPWSTLWPTAWYPVADTKDGRLRAGATAAGVDVLGRHAWSATALWPLEANSQAVNGGRRARPEWSAAYVYDRWRPAFFINGSDATSFIPRFSGGTRLLDAELRELNVAVGVRVPFLGVQHSQAWQTALNYERDRLAFEGGRRTLNRNALQSAWAFDSANQFGYSISPEGGVAVGLTSEQVREALGARANADAWTGEFRGYLRLGTPHSVLAVRAGAGVATGHASVRRVFYLGGASPSGPLVDFGSDALSMLRGFEDKIFSGRRVAVANVEYRQPLWRIERGQGTLPFYLQTLHAAAFLDAGAAWDARFSSNLMRGSLGGELSIDVVLGFNLPLTLSVGLARPYDRAARSFLPAVTYLRVGRSF